MRIKRRYEIEVLPDTHTRKVAENVYDPKLKKVVPRVRTIKGGFNVYFPQGHLTFFETREQMEAQGVVIDNALIDMDSGLPVSTEMAGMFDHSLREQVERNTIFVKPSQRGRIDDPLQRALEAGE